MSTTSAAHPELPLMAARPSQGPLKQAIDSCQVVLMDSTQSIDDQLTQIDQEINDLLPIEEEARKALVERKATLIGQQVGLPMLSNEVFGWRRKGLPVLVPFIPSQSQVTISYSTSETKMASYAKHHYNDVSHRLQRHWAFGLDSFRHMGEGTYFRVIFGLAVGITVGMLPGVLLGTLFNSTNLTLAIFAATIILGMIAGILSYRTDDEVISAVYNGKIPVEIRQIIRDQEPNFDQIAILAEVNKWSVRRVARPKLDPLLIGYKKSSNSWFLLASYDTTPLEDYIQAEFTT